MVVTRAGRLREWSQGELRLYKGSRKALEVHYFGCLMFWIFHAFCVVVISQNLTFLDWNLCYNSTKSLYLVSATWVFLRGA